MKCIYAMCLTEENPSRIDECQFWYYQISTRTVSQFNGLSKSGYRVTSGDVLARYASKHQLGDIICGEHAEDRVPV